MADEGLEGRRAVSSPPAGNEADGSLPAGGAARRRTSGLWERLGGLPPAAMPEPDSPADLLTRLDDTRAAERAGCDLLLVFAAGPRLFQTGNFLRMISNGGATRQRAGVVGEPLPGDPSYVLIDRPSADLNRLTTDLAGDLNCELLAPELAHFYRFEHVTLLRHKARRDGEPATANGWVPMLEVIDFPLVEHPVKGRDERLTRIRNLLDCRDMFVGCLDTGLADILVPRGWSVYEVRYWVRHEGVSGPVPGFRAEDIDCIWSADKNTIAAKLNQGFEIGLKHVPASGFTRPA